MLNFYFRNGVLDLSYARALFIPSVHFFEYLKNGNNLKQAWVWSSDRRIFSRHLQIYDRFTGDFSCKEDINALDG